MTIEWHEENGSLLKFQEGGARECLNRADEEFGVVILTQLMVAVMQDGKWWTGRALRRRLGVYKGVVTGTLSRLRKDGYVRRARNPKDNQLPITTGRWKDTTARYVYQWTGKPWAPRYRTPDRFSHYVEHKHMSKAWRKLLR